MMMVMMLISYDDGDDAAAADDDDDDDADDDDVSCISLIVIPTHLGKLIRAPSCNFDLLCSSLIRFAEDVFGDNDDDDDDINDLFSHKSVLPPLLFAFLIKLETTEIYSNTKTQQKINTFTNPNQNPYIVAAGESNLGK